jgi:DNA-binding response OmpR family regulator
MKRILVIEDDPAILKGLETVLATEGYDLLVATDGEKGTRWPAETIDLILLDLMLPSKDGFESAGSERQRGRTPILILTSKQEEWTRCSGWSSADDYVTKPFAEAELLARVKRGCAAPQTVGISKPASSTTSPSTSANRRPGKAPVKLSAKEFEILKYFVGAKEVISRDALLDDVWGTSSFTDAHRRQLHPLPAEEDRNGPLRLKHLLTVHTAYKFIK